MINHKFRLSLTEKFFYFLYIFSFVFDFRGSEDGGSTIQFIFLVLSIISAFTLLVTKPTFQNDLDVSKQAKRMVLLWFFFLISSVLPLVYFSVPFSQYIRVVTPFMLFGISLLVTIKLYKRGCELDEILNPILWASIASLFWTPFYYFVMLDLTMEEVRHQIITPLFPIVFSYCLVKSILEKQFDFLSFFILIFAMGLFFLSLTRVYLLMIVVVTLLFLFLSSNAYRNILVRKGALLVTFSICSFILLLPILEMFRAGIISAWVDRIFVVNTVLGFDVTFFTRIAEYKGQMQLLFDNNISPLIGRGIGSSYVWDETYFSLLSAVFHETALEDIAPWTTSHSLWVYSIYSGGLIFGLIVPCYFILCCYSSIRKMKVSMEQGTINEVKCYVFICLCILGFVSLSFTSHPLGVRTTGLVLGILTILPLLNIKVK